MICCHVGGFLHGGDEYFELVMKKISERFCAGKVEEKLFRYIGFSSLVQSLLPKDTLLRTYLK